MHNLLFANQQALAPERLAEHTKTLGLDATAFQKCIISPPNGTSTKSRWPTLRCPHLAARGSH